MITKNIFGISTLVLSAFFFYIVNILAFVNQAPPSTRATPPAVADLILVRQQ